LTLTREILSKATEDITLPQTGAPTAERPSVGSRQALRGVLTGRQIAGPVAHEPEPHATQPNAQAQLLAEHRTRHPGGPADPVFPAPLNDYRTARRLFRAAALAAQLHDGGRNPSGVPKPTVTIHDLRHTPSAFIVLRQAFRSSGYRS
jgi:hypothetical protein